MGQGKCAGVRFLRVNKKLICAHTGDLQGCEHVPTLVHNMVLLAGTANTASRHTAYPRRSLPRLRLCLANPRRGDPDRVGQGQRPDGGEV